MTTEGQDQDNDALVSLGDEREIVDAEPYREFARLCAEGRPVALVTVVGTEGSVPRGMGAVMLVRMDRSIVGTIGGGQLEHRAIDDAMAAMKDGRARLLNYDFSGTEESNLDMAYSGTALVFVQPSEEAPELIIFGAGHIGAALAPMARSVGFNVSVIDDRPGYPDATVIPHGIRIISSGYPEVMERIDFREATTYIVVVTHAHESDTEVVEHCLERPWKYLGMIGSKKKVAKVVKILATSQERLKRVRDLRAPIGLDLGGRSPGEIAVSILAELLMVRHDRSATKPMSILTNQE